MSSRTESKFVIENIFRHACGCYSLWCLEYPVGHDSGASLAFDCGSLFVSTAHYEQLMSVPSSVDRHTPCSTMSVDIILD